MQQLVSEPGLALRAPSAVLVPGTACTQVQGGATGPTRSGAASRHRARAGTGTTRWGVAVVEAEPTVMAMEAAALATPAKKATIGVSSGMKADAGATTARSDPLDREGAGRGHTGLEAREVTGVVVGAEGAFIRHGHRIRRGGHKEDVVHLCFSVLVSLVLVFLQME
ncbi:hypothetical protein ABZP36_010779 [Zizania latifolia]